MTRLYDIGPFRLDAGSGVLTRDGAPVALGSRAVAVLATLVDRAHEFVAKGSIIDAAWQGVVVEESNLPVQIAAIRRALAKRRGASAGSRRSSAGDTGSSDPSSRCPNPGSPDRAARGRIFPRP